MVVPFRSQKRAARIEAVPASGCQADGNHRDPAVPSDGKKADRGNRCRLSCIARRSGRVLIFRHVRQQANESCLKYCATDGSLIQSRSSRATPRQNTTFTVNQASKCLQVFIIDVNWPRHIACRAELARHLLLFEPCAAFSQLLQVCAGNRWHCGVSNSW